MSHPERTVVLLLGSPGDEDAAGTVEEIRAALEGAPHEVLVGVARGDGPGSISARLAESAGDVVLVMRPGDAPEDAAGLARLVDAVRRRGAAAAIGGRREPRRGLDRAGDLAWRALTGRGLPDRDAGPLAFSRRLVDEAPIEGRGAAAVGLELLVRARARGGDVLEVPTARPPVAGRVMASLPRRTRLRWLLRDLYGAPLSSFTGGASLALFALVAALIGLGQLMLPGVVAGDELDASWQQVLRHAAAEGWQLGSDVVFTYGPLGWLLQPTFDDRLFVAGLLLDVVLKGLLAAWLARAALGAGGPLRAILFIFGAASLLLEEALLLAGALLVGRDLCLARRRPPWRVALGLAYLAFVGWTKFNVLVFAVLVVLVAGAVATWRRRSARPAVVLVGGFAGAATLLWMLAGQSPLGLPGYLSTSWQLASGYSEAMVVSLRPHGEQWLGLALLLAWGGAALADLAGRPGDRAGRLGFLVLVAAFAWLHYKAGFVRHDGHVFKFFGVAATLPLLHVAKGEGPRALRRLRAGLVAGVVGVSLVVLTFPGPSTRSPTREATVELGRRVVGRLGFLADLPASRERLRALRSARAAELALPRVREIVGDGTVDMVGAEAQGLLLLNDLRYAPRPVFQSYLAYTPALLERNARHLEGDDAPDFVLTRLETIDGRYAGTGDGPGLLAILRRYAPRGFERGMLLLERTDRPPRPPGDAAAAARLLLERTAGWGETVDLRALPETRLALALDIRESPVGRLRRTLHRAPRVFLETTGPGGTRRHRLVPGMARLPFPLQPLLTDVPSLLAWYAPGGVGLATGRVESLRVTTVGEAARGRFEPEIGVRIYTVPAADVAPVDPGAPGVASAIRLLGARPLVSPGREARGLLSLGDGRWALDAHAPARFSVPVPAGARRLALAFGIRRGAYEGGGATDGVVFRVIAPGDGGDDVWLERRLDPVGRPEDRGTARAEIPLPEGVEPGGEIILETTWGPAGDGAWDWSYWEDVRFEAP